VTDITYIRPWLGWLYLAVVMDLFSRKIVAGLPDRPFSASWYLMPLLKPYAAVAHETH
jgi:hypothetical protein